MTQLDREIAASLAKKSRSHAVMAKSAAKRVNDYMAKYMELLKIECERPVLKLHNTFPKADWLGRLDKHYLLDEEGTISKGSPAVMNVQKALLGDDDRLERVVAHEMIHLRDFYAQSDDEAAREVRAQEAGTPREQHGPTFREGAARVNAIMGTDFVTEKESITRSDFNALQAQATGSSLHKVVLALGVAGLGILGARMLLRRQYSTSQQPPPPRPPRPPRRGRRENERGQYGKK